MAGIDHNSPVPYYAQVVEIIQEKISEGNWKPGDKLPAESDLCRIFGVSRTVIRQALSELDHQGAVYRRKGKGTYVSNPKITAGFVQSLTGLYEDMSRQGYQLVTRVLKQQVVPADKRTAANLEVPPMTDVIEIERLRSVEGDPISLVTTYLPVALCSKAATANLETASLYKFLEDECSLQINSGRRIIEAVAARPYEAEHLQVQVNTPLIMIDSVSYLSDGTPLEYYHALHRSDRARFEVNLVRMRESMNS